ncbi:MAG: NAD(P)(+) transhydrogenase (Re/Si-specific) subunit beta [Candidatus Eremiobacteraeota bacterium]|nr:NAD(P)(+) transhydrogenase (Re/Si-specific) subunit beta [Candidatus Eremiobacteraeota bacterium]
MSESAVVTPSQLGIDFAYLVTGVCFIMGLRYMNTPRTARLGNYVSMAGMAIALVATGALLDWSSAWWIAVVGLVAGAAVGIYAARAVKMTAMPQMVAIFNGAGGGAAALVSTAEFLKLDPSTQPVSVEQGITIVLSSIVGAISFTGSIIAFLKLQELMTGRPITYPGQQIVNGLLAFIAIAGAVCVMANISTVPAYFVALTAAAVLGVLFVLPIGGADMPVVISLLNSFTGLAAALTGFVLGNNVLIISGALVGASGTLLTLMMGKAMNRSITNVLFGAFGAVKATEGGAASSSTGGAVRESTIDDVATMLAYARQVVVVPGYGMAVAQAQHSVRELADQLEKKGVEVKYAIHPVAGRMPGHMNVLLAEANVPYPALVDMEDINPEFPRTDVALIIGANDVTNPDARSNTSSPIYGMPILDVDKANQVVVLKRSMKPGFAGIDNPLYELPNTSMLFGDAKASIDKLVGAVKTL